MNQISFDIDRIDMIVRKTEPKGFHFDNLRRPEAGFVYFEEGEGVFTDGNGTAFPIAQGDMVLLWEEDDYRFEFPGPCRYITSAMTFSSRTLPLRTLFPRVTACRAEEQALLERVEKIWQTQNWDSLMQCRLALMELYLDILRTRGNFRAEQDDWVTKALAYIHEHYRGDFSVEKLAQTMAVSATGLRSRFKAAMGCGILAYREKLRIRTASSMLSSGIFSIQEIADALGYCDAAHFSKAFKRAVGSTPGAFAKAHKKALPSA